MAKKKPGEYRFMEQEEIYAQQLDFEQLIFLQMDRIDKIGTAVFTEGQDRLSLIGYKNALTILDSMVYPFGKRNKEYPKNKDEIIDHLKSLDLRDSDDREKYCDALGIWYREIINLLYYNGFLVQHRGAMKI